MQHESRITCSLLESSASVAFFERNKRKLPGTYLRTIQTFTAVS